MHRAAPVAPATLAFTPLEIELLDRLRPAPLDARSQHRPSVSLCLMQLARLGGYLARASDPPPGNTVIWHGMARLADIEFGFLLRAESWG